MSLDAELSTDEARKQKVLEEHLVRKFRKALKMNANGDGTPFWKNLFFILDHMGQGDFYGTIVLKILGCVCKDVKITDRTFKVDEMYRDTVSRA